MSKAVKIRNASLKDLVEVSGMILELAKFEKRLAPTFKTIDKKRTNEFKKCAKKYLKKNSNTFLLIAEINKQAAGFIHCEIQKRPNAYTVKKIGFITDLFTKTKYRNKQIGAKLIQKAIKKLKNKKIKHVWLEALTTNTKALKFYEKQGFKEFKKKLKKQI